jgi:hypothetical protein
LNLQVSKCISSEVPKPDSGTPAPMYSSTVCLPYFRTADRQQRLLNQVHLWSKTRWQHSGTRPNEMKCGVTGDCLFWVHVFKEIGGLPEHLVIPDYRQMEAAGDKMKMLRTCIEATGRAEFVWDSLVSRPIPDKRIGDVLIFGNGMSGAHCGLVVRDFPCHFFHIGQSGAVTEPLAQNHWQVSLAVIYRLVEEVEPTPSASLPPLLGGDKGVGETITTEGVVIS